MDARKLWSGLLKEIVDKPSMNWVRALELRRYEGGVAQIAVLPGQRDLARFATTAACQDQLARLLTTIAGRPVRIDLAASPSGAPPSELAAPDADSTANDSKPGLSAQQAMALPLVKQVMEVFDVTLVEVREEQVQSPKSKDQVQE